MHLFDAIFKNDSLSPAIIYNNREINYGELRAQTLKIAKGIALLEAKRGDRVALLLNDSPEFVEAFIAICSMGAIAVPINMSLRVEEQRAILHDCRASMAIVEGAICNSLLTGASETLQQLPNIAVVEREEKSGIASDIGTTFTFEDPPHGRLQSFRNLVEAAEGRETPDFPEPADDDPAFILYTSGSTGEPKGAVHRQASIFCTNETFCREVLQLNSNDRLFSSSRLPFAYGLGNSLSFPLLNGATAILCHDKPTPQIFNETLVRCRPTIFFGVPVVYNLLLEHHRRESPIDCSSLRLCVSAGEALPAHLGEEWESTFGVKVLDGIGSTEMLHMFMSNHEDALRYGSSGRVLRGYEARLLDETGVATDVDKEGNLWIKGESSAMGYWQKPNETKRTFIDGWVRTGDLYRRDSDGFWFHMGRSDDCFKSSGQWVSPIEVEGVLLRHKGVAGAAVVEGFDEGQLPCPCAFVVARELESNLHALEFELRELSASSLPRFKRPRKFVFVEELPYTATGKIQRFKLRQLVRELKNRGVSINVTPGSL